MKNVMGDCNMKRPAYALSDLRALFTSALKNRTYDVKRQGNFRRYRKKRIFQRRGNTTGQTQYESHCNEIIKIFIIKNPPLRIYIQLTLANSHRSHNRFLYSIPHNFREETILFICCVCLLKQQPPL